MATTKTDPKLSVAGSSGRKARNLEGLTREQLIEAYRIMIYTPASHRRPGDYAQAPAEIIFFPDVRCWSVWGKWGCRRASP